MLTDAERKRLNAALDKIGRYNNQRLEDMATVDTLEQELRTLPRVDDSLDLRTRINTVVSQIDQVTSQIQALKSGRGRSGGLGGLMNDTMTVTLADLRREHAPDLTPADIQLLAGQIDPFFGDLLVLKQMTPKQKDLHAELQATSDPFFGDLYVERSSTT